jgi:hypothetical protein
MFVCQLRRYAREVAPVKAFVRRLIEILDSQLRVVHIGQLRVMLNVSAALDLAVKHANSLKQTSQRLKKFATLY